ncbi:siroheme synthase CysG [Actibacterium atlanticum]|uniref:Siroheme synthase CysG n=1 Tax=Actibacterium atlanticum TaxID=1461693 RepID=A0A058ZPU7_9RHOB|nr:siroheme synthase CysG [Actibacterium atlanticum]KCV82866.1 siroheme synthase CysG [Actibacterium atlanticum]
MKTFPMFLKMSGRRVVICGGGETAAQKTRLMLKTEAQIDILAPELDDELAALADAGKVNWVQGAITPAVFERTALVFVATGCPATDACLHALADEAGALINVVDQPDLCDAVTPSIVDRDPVVVAIGTEGTAPVLGRQIKTQIEERLEPRLGDLAALAGRLRDKAAARLQPRQRRDLWRWVFDGPVRETHARGAERDAAQLLKDTIETGSIPEAQSAPVALVGAGPGSRDLITLRGVQRLQEADIIFYDRLVDPELLELARRDAERVYVGKAPGAHSMPQAQINSVLVSAAKRGQRVVRLKCGDPGIFARGAEEADALRAAGIEVEIVPGVTAASAAAAATGTFLTERGRIDALVLTTGHKADASTPPEWVTHLHSGARVAVYMGISKAGQIVELLEQAHLLHDTEVQIVSRAETPDQRSFSCPASELTQLIADHDIAHPSMLFLSRKQVAEHHAQGVA